MFPTRTELATSESFPELTVIYLEYYELRKPENVARLEWLDLEAFALAERKK
jgi:hypothetical protein